MSEGQNTQRPDVERRPAEDHLEEHGVVTDLLIGAGGGAAGNLAADAVKAGAGKIAGKVKGKSGGK
jgi:hypothetical protein